MTLKSANKVFYDFPHLEAVHYTILYFVCLFVCLENVNYGNISVTGDFSKTVSENNQIVQPINATVF